LAKIPSDINEHLFTLYNNVVSDGRKVVVELGVRAGLSTQALLTAIAQMPMAKLYSYDLDPLRPKDTPPNTTLLERIPEAQNYDFWDFKFGPEKGNSLLVHDQWGPESIDYLFIDTEHKPEQLYKELNLWHGKVKNTGLIVLHDTIVPAFRLKEAISQFLKENANYRYMEYMYNNGLGVIFELDR